MVLVARSTIRANARLYADMRPDGDDEFVDNTEANRLINLAAAELWDRLIALRGGEAFEAVNTALPTVSGTSTLTMPTNFYRLIALDLRWSATRIEPVPQLSNIADRYRFNEASWGEGEPKAFRQRGNGNTTYLELFPTPSANTNTEIRYITSFTPLATNNSDDTTQLDGFNGWDRAVALNVALQMRMIAGLETREVASLYAADLERIDNLISDRTETHAARIRDVYPEGFPGDEDWMRLRTPAS